MFIDGSFFKQASPSSSATFSPNDPVGLFGFILGYELGAIALGDSQGAGAPASEPLVACPAPATNP